MPFLDLDPYATWKSKGGKSPHPGKMQERDLPAVRDDGAVEAHPTPTSSSGDAGAAREARHSNTLAGRRQGRRFLEKIDTGFSRQSDEANAEDQSDSVNAEASQEQDKSPETGQQASQEERSGGTSSILPDEDAFEFGLRRHPGSSTSAGSRNRRRRQKRKSAARESTLGVHVQQKYIVSYNIELVAAELRVKYRLFPAMVLLSHPEVIIADANLKNVREAGEYAIAAWRVAREYRVNDALQARCAYYLGLAEYLLADKDERGIPISLSQPNSPDSPDSFGDEFSKTACVRYFTDACAAKGVYDEGEWAQQWLNYFKSAALSPSTNTRPQSAGSWVGGVWNAVRNVLGSTGSEVFKSPPRNRIDKRKARDFYADEAFSPKSERNRGQGERIPDFSSLGSEVESQQLPRQDSLRSEGVSSSGNCLTQIADTNDILDPPSAQDGEQSLPHSIVGGNISIQGFKSSPRSTSQRISPVQVAKPPAKTYRITNPDPPSDSAPSTKEQTTEDRITVLTRKPPHSPSPKSAPAWTPQISPTAPSSQHSRAISIAFASDLESGISTTNRSSIYERRRKPSILNPLTWRERQPSDLERMEEGESPYRATFDRGVGGGGGWRKRKEE